MDKTMQDIPVNIRIIGTPGGEVIIYLEDYVYTFFRKVMECENENTILKLYGHKVTDGDRQRFLVSGACGEEDVDAFADCEYIGTAKLSHTLTCDIEIHFVSPQGISTKHDSYYIYYDRNEEMQNYLIKWNNEQSNRKNRMENDKVVRYSRLTQEYNKEEARVSFIWNVMNVLSLGFVICIMAYSITSINSYHKIKEMEETIDYIVATISNRVDETADEYMVKATEEVVYKEESTEQTVEEKTIFDQEKLTSPEKEKAVETVVSDATRYYVVRKGDTLYSISCEIYGNGSKVDEICRMNKLDNPDSILLGQKLLLP